MNKWHQTALLENIFHFRMNKLTLEKNIGSTLKLFSTIIAIKYFRLGYLSPALKIITEAILLDLQ